MMFVWNAWAAIHLFVGLLVIAAAAFIFFLRPHALQNRRLGWALHVEGLVFLTVAATWFAAGPSEAYAARVVNQALVWGWPLSYLAFLGTLDSPLARPFGKRTAWWSIHAAWGAGAASVLLWPAWYIKGMTVTPIGTHDAVWGSANSALALLFQGVFIFALAVAFTAWRRAPRGTVQRSRALAFFVAFGARDLLLLASIIIGPAVGLDRFPGLATIVVLQIGAILLFVPLLTYGILKTQLFDIDLKIKWTVSRGTLASIILVTFFVVSQLVENLASDSLGVLAGSLAAGLLLFLIHPLTRFADRVADAAMPGVQDTEEYRTVRKREVYRAALESARQEGTMTSRERALLATLATELGLTPRDVLGIEQAGASPGSGAAPDGSA